MNFFKRYIPAYAVIVMALVFLTSCDDDFNTIGTSLVASDNFDVNNTLINEVFITYKLLGRLRSYFLPF